MAGRFQSPVTADDYDRMIEQGLLTAADRVELIEGEIVEKMGQDDPHFVCILMLNELFRFRAPTDLVIGVQGPIWMSPDSVPEPDVFLIRRPALHVRPRPRPEDIALLIEVCDTSLAWDRSVKLPLYARAGVPEVWLVDLNGQRLLRYLEPEPAPPEGWRKGGRAPTWGHEDLLGCGAFVAPAACPETRLSIDEILAAAPPGR